MELPSINPKVGIGGGGISTGYNENQATGYSHPQHHVTPNHHMQFGSSSFAPPNHLDDSQQPQITRSDSTCLALGSPQQSYNSTNPQVQSEPSISYDNWSQHRDEYLTEEEIRMRSQEMLENKDMQHLLKSLQHGWRSFS